MKKYFSIIKIFIISLVVFLTGCVQDDKYGTPDLSAYMCQTESYFTNPANNFVKWSIADLKAKTQKETFAENAYIEGYVSSTDASGNIYKYIYVQDAPKNPTQGLIVSVDAVSTYTKYPQGAKVYIKLKGLAMGTYFGTKQLGYMDKNTFDRIPEKMLSSSIFKSCSEKATIIPKVMTLAEMKNENDQYIGCLVKVPNAEFDAKVLCLNFAPDGETVDRQLNDPTNPSFSVVVRNSSFASFANQTLPTGKGDFIGILSKYATSSNTTYQLYINNVSDLKEMKNFPRKDGLTANPCSFDPNTTSLKSIADVKKIFTSGNNTQITDNIYIKAQVTANDETGNLYRYIYVQDATGGIRININKANTIYQDSRFKVGKNVIVKLKDLYIGKFNGELQIGILSGTNIGFIPEANVYKYFFDSNESATKVIATEKTIPQLTADDVGKWIKIKDVQFVASDLGNSFSGFKTLEDCSGNKIILRTSSFASFSTQMVDNGKGDIYAILSIFNGTYQLWIPFQYNADFDNARCDGSLPVYENIFTDGFTNLNNWIPVNISGSQAWTTTTFGNPAPSAIMNGNRSANEDWLISKKITIPASGYQKNYFSFETDGNFQGNPLEVYITDNYTGSVATTTWTKVNASLDTDLGGFNGFVNSGLIDVTAFKGKDLVVAFKYTSVNGASTTWEIDNFAVKGLK